TPYVSVQIVDLLEVRLNSESEIISGVELTRILQLLLLLRILRGDIEQHLVGDGLHGDAFALETTKIKALSLDGVLSQESDVNDACENDDRPGQFPLQHLHGLADVVAVAIGRFVLNTHAPPAHVIRADEDVDELPLVLVVHLKMFLDSSHEIIRLLFHLPRMRTRDARVQLRCLNYIGGSGPDREAEEVGVEL
ncbi:hypothetical protein PMAYCL1PPCAC_25352, partial [Pristionchus mayeri]